MYILSPVVINQKGSHQILLAKIKRDGFLRVKINGEIFLLDKDITLDKNKKWTIEIVIDRLSLAKDSLSRISEAIEIALNYSGGFVSIEPFDGQTKMFFYST